MSVNPSVAMICIAVPGCRRSILANYAPDAGGDCAKRRDDLINYMLDFCLKPC